MHCKLRFISSTGPTFNQLEARSTDYSTHTGCIRQTGTVHHTSQPLLGRFLCVVSPYSRTQVFIFLWTCINPLLPEEKNVSPGLVIHLNPQASGARWNPRYYIRCSALSFQGIRLWTFKVIYRVSHETWQFLNSFKCLLPYAVLDIKDFLQFILF